MIIRKLLCRGLVTGILLTRLVTETFAQTDPANTRPAIDKIPSVERIDSASEARPSSIKPTRLVAVFRNPCHFPYHDPWDCYGSTSETGVVIYEDMKLVVGENGQYELSFVAESPRLPVTLRLQFRIWMKPKNNDPDREQGTLTIPPIVFEPSDEAGRQDSSETFLVRRTGYSHALKCLSVKDACGCTSSCRCSEQTQCRLQRTGVARFGGVPDNNETYFAAAAMAE